VAKKLSRLGAVFTVTRLDAVRAELVQSANSPDHGGDNLWSTSALGDSTASRQSATRAATALSFC
jgi:hypothetical protein